MGNASLVEQILEQYPFIIFGFIVVRIHDGEGFARHFFEVGHSEHERSGDGASDAEFGRSGGGGGLGVERDGRLGNGDDGGEEEQSERKMELERHGEAFRSPRCGCSEEGQFLRSMTSVDLITAETLSPTLSFISSALRRVMTLSMRFCPTRTTT